MKDTDICNIALGWLGGNLIMSMDDDTTEADLCQANYETSIKATLEAVDWTFARGRARLVPLVGEVIGTDYSTRFALPPNCLVVRFVSVTGTYRDTVTWEKERHELLANDKVLFIKYTEYATDPNKYTSKFIHLAASQLAADICVPLTASKTQEKMLRGKVEMLIDQAGGSDGVQSLPQKVTANTMQKARFRHIGGY